MSCSKHEGILFVDKRQLIPSSPHPPFGERRNWNLNAEVNYSILSIWQPPLSQAECVFEACGGRICWDSSLRGLNIRKGADGKHASPNTHEMKLIWSAGVTRCAPRRRLVLCEAVIMPHVSVWMERDELTSFLTASVLMASVGESPPVTNMIHFRSLMLIEVALCSSRWNLT